MVAPDLPGFGQSDMPPRDKFSYTFDNVARVIERLRRSSRSPASEAAYQRLQATGRCHACPER
jgi:hypothetical protein